MAKYLLLNTILFLQIFSVNQCCWILDKCLEFWSNCLGTSSEGQAIQRSWETADFSRSFFKVVFKCLTLSFYDQLKKNPFFFKANSNWFVTATLISRSPKPYHLRRWSSCEFAVFSKMWRSDHLSKKLRRTYFMYQLF